MSVVNTAKREIPVVGAVILRDNYVLCVQRGPNGSLPGMWEFPGGKIEAGESAREALEREIDEELLCEVEVGAEVVTTRHEYDFAVIILTTFFCKLKAGNPRLTEHSAERWLKPDRLASLEWAPADVPAVEKIAQLAARGELP